jgi:hypothetical protein
MWGSVAEYYSNNSRKWYLPCPRDGISVFSSEFTVIVPKKTGPTGFAAGPGQEQSHSLLLECNEGLIIAAKLSFLRPSSLFQLRRWKLHVDRSG